MKYVRGLERCRSTAFLEFYVTRYSVFYFLLDPFPRASCLCIRRGIVSTRFFFLLFKGSFCLAVFRIWPDKRSNLEHVIVFAKYII